MPILRATFITLSAPSPLTTYNLGTSTVCHPDLLVLVFNLVVDLGYVVEQQLNPLNQQMQGSATD